MRFLIRAFFVLVLLAVVVAGGAYVYAGRMPGPAIDISKPDKFVGTATPLEVAVTTPGGTVSALQIVFEQNGKQTPIYTQGAGGSGPAPQVSGDKIVVSRELGKQTVPDIKSGAARIIVNTARPVLRGMRTIQSSAAKDVQVRLERPRVSVVSTFHYINQGGSEMVLYRVSPEDVESGVLVGDIEYPGFPASGAVAEDIKIADPALRVAFYSLLYDQKADTPMRVFARDAAGNSARADFDFRVFPKAFKKSRIELDDKFLDRVVPAILEGTSEVKPEGDTLAKFLVINSELRKKNAEKIASFAKQTSPEMLWGGVVFHPFTNSAVESAFADQRTYIYKGKDVDQQTHLGFDLASLAGNPVVAANRGKVLYADELGIYGNCVIIDHGMGVQSLYGHLSSIGVKAGDMVTKEQVLGRSGMTGLAGGDHLHFTMLVNGRMVNPVEWWDSHWIQDRILRKLRTSGGS